MKKILFLATALSLTLLSCGPSKAELEAKKMQGLTWNSELGAFVQTDPSKLNNPDYSDIEIRTIDGHEYIILKTEHTGCTSCGPINAGILHKENCSNPDHQKTE